MNLFLEASLSEVCQLLHRCKWMGQLGIAHRSWLFLRTFVLFSACSTEVNPVEHVWEEIREKHFYNRVFNSMEAVMDTLCEGLKRLIDMPERLSSMTYFPI